MARIGVIGAGLSGLTAAAALADAGHSVCVLDKGRGPGGRMSTRRAADGRQFDHGAQYFTVEDETFARAVSAWERAGVVETWEGIIGSIAPGQGLAAAAASAPKPRYVGVPSMNAVCKLMRERLGVAFGVRIASISRREMQWTLRDDLGDDRGEFDAVVIAVPAPQAALLLETSAPEMAESARRAKMRSCWAVMAACPDLLPIEFDGLFINGGPLAWAARDNSKPGRPAMESWVLHALGVWSDEHVDESQEQAGNVLVSEFLERMDLPASAIGSWTAHRWRYALPDPALPSRVLESAEGSLVACGDWCGGPRVEGAFLSGIAAAHQLLEQFDGTSLGSGDGI
ncbi:Dehydrosqualene desaturase [Pirellulimonas nuda]|uniref:Dehydrosqualene desaturase n=1 Tax=Pirellulimonas nuda TaxID=2528009 RepID=A0A518D8B4_9BACT|nr:FAD-dependent oxidoreductase [Pirellulimonas nuda]QDU87695.1 Dehydrosqualene desaturase [Pirellulimonas nuda]